MVLRETSVQGCAGESGYVSRGDREIRRSVIPRILGCPEAPYLSDAESRSYYDYYLYMYMF
jgi:hypothetical protein